MDKPPLKVLDAYAVMAFLEGEAGSDHVRKLLLQSVRGETRLAMTAVNLGEVYYSVVRTSSVDLADKIVQDLLGMQLEVVAVEWEIARQAAHLKAEVPIAYADCFSAALAMLLDCPVVTGDEEFRRLESKVNVEWLNGKDQAQ